MGKSRPGYPKLNDLIISVPKLQSLRKRFASALLTLIFWAIWLYLWIPLITLIGWLLGFDSVYFQMIELKGLNTLVDRLGLFAAAIALLALTLGSWALYNFLRFRGADYRKPFPPVSDQELSAFFKVEKKKLLNAKNSRFITVRFTDEGQISELVPETEAIDPFPTLMEGKTEAEYTP